MGMPKQYNRAELLDTAVEVFRRHGYNGTSTAQLVDELGVNRKSMYSEFGSKQGLFEATLEHYDGKHLSRVLANVEAPDASVDEIRQAFHGYASAIEGRYRGLGCLMCNTAAERGALDSRCGPYIDAYFARLTRTFQKALENGRRMGDIDRTIDVNEMASFLTTALIGFAACIRAEAPKDQIWASYRIMSKTLDALSSGPK